MFTTADLTALKSALAKGVRKVRINGEEVEYHSVADMLRVKALMEAELQGASSSAVRIVYPTTGRGL
jgi:hypothetical protein